MCPVCIAAVAAIAAGATSSAGVTAVIVNDAKGGRTMTQGERMAWTAGRVLLSLIFILSALGKLADLNGTGAFMRAAGMPMVWFFLPAAIVLELGGGLAILSGYGARLGVVALIVFLIPATLIFHPFWQVTGVERIGQLTNFMKNVAIIGGLLIVVPASLAAQRAAD